MASSYMGWLQFTGHSAPLSGPQDLDSLVAPMGGPSAPEPEERAPAARKEAKTDSDLLRQLMDTQPQVAPPKPAAAAHSEPAAPARIEVTPHASKLPAVETHTAQETRASTPQAPATGSEKKSEAMFSFKDDEPRHPAAMEAMTGPARWAAVVLMLTATGLFTLLWAWRRYNRSRLQQSGLPIAVLGQTWLDAGTRIILLKVGAKVLVLAKASGFCSTLDVITDSEEVNLLTLRSGVGENDEGFRRILADERRRTNREEAGGERELRKELNDLKEKLGRLS